jgi:hypothetical protein
MTLSQLRTWIRQLLNDQRKKDGHDVFQFCSSSVFNISEDFIDSTSIKVYKNGTLLLNADWDYDSDTNQVTIDIIASGQDLITDDDVEITYNYYAKYSDEELDGYIEGALLYFTEFRHSKTYMIDEDEVVSCNDEDPTTEEGHLIALVTAIHIDPQNINLRTPDITRSGTQFKSKKDQIIDTITRWQRTLGKIQFLEDENC